MNLDRDAVNRMVMIDDRDDESARRSLAACYRLLLELATGDAESQPALEVVNEDRGEDLYERAPETGDVCDAPQPLSERRVPEQHTAMASEAQNG